MNRRVVLDTNCVISALLFSKPKLAWLRHSWQNGDITPLASKDTVSELIRVFSYPKFKLTKAEQELLLADFLPYVATVRIESIPANLPQISNKADQMFLIVAEVGKAEILVTGDADILAIKPIFHAPPIVTLAEFKEWLTI